MNVLSKFARLLRRLECRFMILSGVLLVVGCAQIPGETPLLDAQHAENVVPHWSGRLALQVKDEPSQSFSANFELKGTVKQGNLKLLSPLGSVFAVLLWSPQGAWLNMPGRAERYDTLQTLLTQVNGAPLPIEALFEWLSGIPTSYNGWTVNLDKYPDGRVSAGRTDPATELRIILDQP